VGVGEGEGAAAFDMASIWLEEQEQQQVCADRLHQCVLGMMEMELV
jgi:hypothetical protein